MSYPHDRPETASEALEHALTRSLETAPQVAVPPDFAQRLMTRLPEEQLAFASKKGSLPLQQGSASLHNRWHQDGLLPDDGPLPEPRTGRRIAFVALAFLLAAFFLLPILTAHAYGSHPFAYMALWCTFVAEFILLTLWLSLRPDLLR